MPTLVSAISRFTRPFKPFIVAIALLTAAASSSAVAPIKSNLIMGMDIQGQRLNLYYGCEEGYVSCDDMALVATDLASWGFTADQDKKSPVTPFTVKIYPAKTKHSLCKDGVTPCGFQGYIFSDDRISGFIDLGDNTVSLSDAKLKRMSELNFKESTDYLPLTGNAALIDRKYIESDKGLNDTYNAIKSEVAQWYGYDTVAELKTDQTQWIIRRTKNCGADSHHRPRTQAEKVFFIGQNEARMAEYFLWID
jgi:hypothetical protein